MNRALMDVLSDEAVQSARSDMKKAINQTLSRPSDLSALRQIHLETALFEASYLEKKVMC